MTITDNITIRPVTLSDVPSLISLKQAVWLNESADSNLITIALQTPSHQAFIAVIEGKPAGFISCFISTSQLGEQRWEVDLLAVHPNFRRRGLATQLVQTAIQARQATGAGESRALIAIDNKGSEMSFAKNGYTTDDQIYTLYISMSQPDGKHIKPIGAHLVQVNTFNYRGVWLEAKLSDKAFLGAQSKCAQENLDLVGVLIPDNRPAEQALAQGRSFKPVSKSRWWHRPL
ncbi:MAG: GNAT superfamily N-acetyltransferase [Cellvibrionaceae bacterium]|jgi:GNAT superfamily N-acetyltransferase